MPELRQDIVSGDWVLLAPGRAKRPKFLDEKKKKRVPSLKSTCPFEHLEKSDNWPPVLAWPSVKQWKLAVIPNKYPAVSHEAACSIPYTDGIYQLRTAVGTHDLLIARDHNAHFGEIPSEQAVEVVKALQDFHRLMEKDKCSVYVSSFYNYGPSAGASVWHPHYQIITLPIVPPHIQNSLHGAKAYFKNHHRCVRCDMIKTEIKHKSRVIAENDRAVAFVPYASKKPFQVSIMPKKHHPSFRQTSDETIKSVALLLQSSIKKMKKYLNDPDLNFFIHDAPIDGRDHEYHHWHIQLIPKTSIDAGFELSTYIDINIVDPDKGSALLRGKKVL